MFTGLIDHTGEILAIEQSDDHALLSIATEFTDLALGDSVAVDGMCVTVVALVDSNSQPELLDYHVAALVTTTEQKPASALSLRGAQRRGNPGADRGSTVYFSVQLSKETLTRTQALQYRVGQQVNLERPLQYNGRLDGHLVSGHIDRVMQCSKIESQQEFSELQFSGATAAELALFSEKGSVAVNGVSLTINRVLKDGFAVMLIPHTLAITNLSQLKEGDVVNIEFDQLAKMVARQLQCQLNTHKQGVEHV